MTEPRRFFCFFCGNGLGFLTVPFRVKCRRCGQDVRVELASVAVVESRA